jgi:hypothetical protein
MLFRLYRERWVVRKAAAGLVRRTPAIKPGVTTLVDSTSQVLLRNPHGHSLHKESRRS